MSPVLWPLNYRPILLIINDLQSAEKIAVTFLRLLLERTLRLFQLRFYFVLFVLDVIEVAA